MVFRSSVPNSMMVVHMDPLGSITCISCSGAEGQEKSKVSLARPGDGESFVVVRGYIWVCKGLFHILWAGAGGFRVQLGFRGLAFRV